MAMKLKDDSPVVGTVTVIDMTPTWAETANMVARLFVHGDSKGQDAALDTLKQMGAICDAYRDAMKDGGAVPRAIAELESVSIMHKADSSYVTRDDMAGAIETALKALQGD